MHNDIQEVIRKAENDIAFYEIVYGPEPTEEEVIEARVRQMIKNHLA